MNFDKKYIDWILNKIEKEFKDDIALLVLYGSYHTGTYNEGSDIDMFFVPKTDRGWALSKTFIYKNVGYDIFGISWDRLEGIAYIEEDLCALLDHSKVIYHHSESDMNRFKDIKNKLHMHLRDHEFMHKVVNHKLDQAIKNLSLYKKYPDQLIYKAHTVISLSYAVVYSHHRYLKKGPKDLMYVLDELGEDVFKHSLLMSLDQQDDPFGYIYLVCKYVCDRFNKKIVINEEVEMKIEDNHIDLKSWFEEFVSNFRKIDKAKQEHDSWLLFVTMVSMQDELNAIKHQVNLDLDICRYFDSNQIDEYADDVLKLEQDLRVFLDQNQIKLDEYQDDRFIDEWS